jgi:hypothetical protein
MFSKPLGLMVYWWKRNVVIQIKGGNQDPTLNFPLCVQVWHVSHEQIAGYNVDVIAIVAESL